ncbi:MAG: hypothetical protein A4E66_01609 [Syntrophus sp. PtaB.Bin001]|nr:MAG: hypothetical protein A4E66_01609 [Syntrophus sp. PtaB.Bin001]
MQFNKLNAICLNILNFVSKLNTVGISVNLFTLNIDKGKGLDYLNAINKNVMCKLISKGGL